MPNAEQLVNQILSIPLYPQLTDAEVTMVARAVVEFRIAIKDAIWSAATCRRLVTSAAMSQGTLFYRLSIGNYKGRKSPHCESLPVGPMCFCAVFL